MVVASIYEPLGLLSVTVSLWLHLQDAWHKETGWDRQLLDAVCAQVIHTL